MSQNPERLTKNERRAQARELARQAREAERKREKRNRLLLQGGVAAALVAIVAIVALVITNGVREAGINKPDCPKKHAVGRCCVR